MATDLSTLLTDKGLGVYDRMAPGDIGDYEKNKEAILKRYQFTEDGFRTRFHESPPQVGENPGQFFTNIGNYLVRWKKVANVPGTYEGLRRLSILEQFL